MSIEKEARRDAREFARAQMFYGEGAGTRRKLIGATVDAKAHKSDVYARAFHAELARQDLAEHARKARFERRKIDATHSVDRNVRGLLTGNYQSVNTAVLVIVVGGVIVHKTGLDQKARKKYNEYKRRRQERRMYVVGTNLK